MRITPAELAAALVESGVNPATVDPRTFALSSLGQPVAIRVEDAGTPNIFDGNDRIEFFGQKFRSTLPDALDRQQEEKYTDERVYWLAIGGAQCVLPECRVAIEGAAPLGSPTPPTSFPTTVHAEDNRYWLPLYSMTYDTRDTWYWDQFLLPSGGATTLVRNYPYTTPYPEPGSPASVRLEVLVAALGATNPSHHVTLTLGGATLADEIWNGLGRKVLTGSVSAGALTGTTTGFDVRVSVQAPSTREYLFVNFWELDYHRLFRAYNNQLDFKAENAGLQEFSATDFTSSPVAVWDVTNATQPKRLTGVAMSGASGAYAARFRASPVAGRPFLDAGRERLCRTSQHDPAVRHHVAAHALRNTSRQLRPGRRHGDYQASGHADPRSDHRRGRACSLASCAWPPDTGRGFAGRLR